MHHLTDSEMQAVYASMHDLLSPGGLFLLLDRVAIDKPALYSLYQTIWRWQAWQSSRWALSERWREEKPFAEALVS